MISSKRRAAVASLFVWLVLSPKMLFIAQASRPSGMMPSGILEAGGAKKEEVLMSTDLQYKVAAERKYEGGTVELRWEEEKRILSLVANGHRRLWESHVETKLPPMITMRTEHLGIFIVMLTDRETGTEVKLRAQRVGTKSEKPYTNDDGWTRRESVLDVFHQSKPEPKKVTVLDKSGFIPEEKLQDGDRTEEQMALHLTSVLQSEVSLRFGLHLCLVAGTCLQSCTAPQCVGKECECLPWPFCKLQVTRGQHKTCAPVTANDSFSPTPDPGELTYTDRNVERAVTVSNTTIRTPEGKDQYIVRDESDVVAAFADAVHGLQSGVFEAKKKSGTEQLEHLAKLLPSANLLLSMVQNAHVIKHTLPWTYTGMQMKAGTIREWVESLQENVQPEVSTILKKECGVNVSFESNNSEKLHAQLDVVEAACGSQLNDSASFMELQDVIGDSALIEQKQRTRMLASFIGTGFIIGLLLFGMGSFAASRALFRAGKDNWGRFFLCLGGVSYVAVGIAIMPTIWLAAPKLIAEIPGLYGIFAAGLWHSMSPAMIGFGGAALAMNKTMNTTALGLGPLWLVTLIPA